MTDSSALRQEGTPAMTTYLALAAMVLGFGLYGYRHS